MDALLVGTGKRLEEGAITDLGAYEKAYHDLRSDRKFEESFTGATTDVERL
jgi:hypothetical protein